MRTLDLDLPLDASPLSRFMLWVTGTLVGLAVLAFALASLAQGRIVEEARRPRVVTVALPPAPPGEAEGLVGRVTAMLEREPGAAYAAPVSKAEIDGLVEPLLAGAGAGAADRFPLPRLIDVAFNPGTAPDLGALERRVQRLVPGSTIGDAGPLGSDDGRLVRLLRALGLATGSVFVLLALVAVVMVTRMSLRQHHETVDLLRLMGARDGYVARQFEHHALLGAFKGGLIGFAAAMLVVVGVVHGPAMLGDPPVVPVRLRPLDWVLLSMVPVVTALLVTLTARLAAVLTLRRT